MSHLTKVNNLHVIQGGDYYFELCLFSKFLYLHFIYVEVRSLSVLLVFFIFSHCYYDSDAQIPGAVIRDDHIVYNGF